MKKLTPNLLVADVNNSVEFYRKVLGFELVVSVPDDGVLDWALMRNGAAEIMLQTRTSMAASMAGFVEPTGCSCVLYVDIDNVRALYDRVRNQVHLVRDLHTTFYGTGEFAIADPDGHILVFAQDMA